MEVTMARRFIGLVILALFLFTSSGIAQAGGVVLILTLNGDLWSWNGTKLERRTTWGYNDDPAIIAPDSIRIAYKSTATVVVNAIKQGRFPGGAGQLPGNIWVLDTMTNNAKRVADQPTGASFATANVPDNYVIRSDPSWSPDGLSLAWTELPVQGGSSEVQYNLVTYSLAMDQTTVIVFNMPPQANYEGYAAMQVKWGKTGIAVGKMDVVSGANGLSVEGTILVYSPNGQLLSTSEKIVNPLGFTWVTDNKKEYVGVVTGGPDHPSKYEMQWTLIDPKTGKITATDVQVELYSRIVQGGITLVPSDVHSTKNWQIYKDNAVVGTIPDLGDAHLLLSALTLSPGGIQIAYSNGTNVVVRDASLQTIVVPNQYVRALTWAPVGWRVFHG
jgi:hypothetical protein